MRAYYNSNLRKKTLKDLTQYKLNGGKIKMSFRSSFLPPLLQIINSFQVKQTDWIFSVPALVGLTLNLEHLYCGAIHCVIKGTAGAEKIDMGETFCSCVFV